MSYQHTISVVIPVYRGEKVLAGVIDELVALYGSDGEFRRTSGGRSFSICEIVLVHDGGPDDSPRVMRELAARYGFVNNVWLSRNYGQHAATLAGIAGTRGDWVVTMDEDGQQDPKFIPDFLDRAVETRSHVVYAQPTNVAPHGIVRNAASKTAKWIAKRLLARTTFDNFNSYRLILAEPARALAAYGGNGVYFDVALLWVAARTTTCPVVLRDEDRPSGYSFTSLLEHFSRLVVTAGARPLRGIAYLGVFVALGGFLMTAYVIYMKLVHGIDASGWTSVVVAVLVTGGLTMLSLGVIAEFLGATVRLTMGKPLYVTVTDPANGPLGIHSD